MLILRMGKLIFTLPINSKLSVWGASHVSRREL